MGPAENNKFPFNVMFGLKELSATDVQLIAGQISNVETLIEFFKTGKITDIFDFSEIEELPLFLKLEQLLECSPLFVLWFRDSESIKIFFDLLNKDKLMDSESFDFLLHAVFIVGSQYHPSNFLKEILTYVESLDPEKDAEYFTAALAVLKREFEDLLSRYENSDRFNQMFKYGRPYLVRASKEITAFLDEYGEVPSKLHELCLELITMLEPMSQMAEGLFVPNPPVDIEEVCLLPESCRRTEKGIWFPDFRVFMELSFQFPLVGLLARPKLVDWITTVNKHFLETSFLIKYIDEHTTGLKEVLEVLSPRANKFYVKNIISEVSVFLERVIKGYLQSHELGVRGLYSKDFFENLYFQVLAVRSGAADETANISEDILEVCDRLIESLVPVVQPKLLQTTSLKKCCTLFIAHSNNLEREVMINTLREKGGVLSGDLKRDLAEHYITLT